MNAPDPSLSANEIARNLWPHHIEQCECGETLVSWFNACRQFADELISQLEADDAAKLRDEAWRRRVSGLLTGAKKSQRQIERRAAAIKVDLPEGRDKRRGEHIARLRAELLEARSTERSRIAEWLVAVHGARGAEIAEELLTKEHVRWWHEDREVAE